MIKYIVSTIGIALAVLGVIYGSFLPLLKAKLYIRAINNFSLIKNLDEFKKNFNRPLDFYSPVGQEEIVKFLATEIIERLIYPGQQEIISRELVNYIEPRFSYTDSKHLLLSASMYGKIFNIYNNKNDLEKTEKYFQEILALNPKSPQALYGLFGVYQYKGEISKAKETAEIILRYWPEDERITVDNK